MKVDLMAKVKRLYKESYGVDLDGDTLELLTKTIVDIYLDPAIEDALGDAMERVRTGDFEIYKG